MSIGGCPTNIEEKGVITLRCCYVQPNNQCLNHSMVSSIDTYYKTIELVHCNVVIKYLLFLN
jgi:hypothetical protein